MNNDNYNENYNHNEGFEDIEQLLKPQCEFKTSDTLKEEVLRKAKDEVAPRRSINMWHWEVAACVLGFVLLHLMPPKKIEDYTVEHISTSRQLMEMQHYVRDYDDHDRYGDFESIEKKMLARSAQLSAGIYPEDNNY